MLVLVYGTVLELRQKIIHRRDGCEFLRMDLPQESTMSELWKIFGTKIIIYKWNNAGLQSRGSHAYLSLFDLSNRPEKIKIKAVRIVICWFCFMESS
ncbi:hypothetical protein AH70_09595 [Pediococcus damnosus LMG 28219]|nr:hypothetical protein AH70_09595 [Pediococcus damnosus LMG 28219]PIO85711.1 hypothetical protein BSQ37_07080 [Pediococcus damnosus]PJE49766.1 hypothetical protein BSQ36_07485 [Pediococcus damnosus]